MENETIHRGRFEKKKNIFVIDHPLVQHHLVSLRDRRRRRDDALGREADQNCGNSLAP